MSVSSDVQNITRASVLQCKATDRTAAFDSVQIHTEGGNASLYLPAGTGQAVADAINAAISPAMVEAAA